MDAASATVIRLHPGTKVQNILGSSKGTIHPSAKQYWKQALTLQGHRAQWPSLCTIAGCGCIAEHGSHVKIYSRSVWGWYIIPTCHKHNKANSNEVRRGALLCVVSDHSGRGCGILQRSSVRVGHSCPHDSS
jgi:hypothetical protein